MKFKRLPVWIVGYLLIIIAPVMIFLHGFLRDVPKLPVYEGSLEFSGELAYADLK